MTDELKAVRKLGLALQEICTDLGIEIVTLAVLPSREAGGQDHLALTLRVRPGAVMDEEQKKVAVEKEIFEAMMSAEAIEVEPVSPQVQADREALERFMKSGNLEDEGDTK